MTSRSLAVVTIRVATSTRVHCLGLAHGALRRRTRSAKRQRWHRRRTECKPLNVGLDLALDAHVRECGHVFCLTEGRQAEEDTNRLVDIVAVPLTIARVLGDVVHEIAKELREQRNLRGAKLVRIHHYHRTLGQLGGRHLLQERSAAMAAAALAQDRSTQALEVVEIMLGMVNIPGELVAGLNVVQKATGVVLVLLNAKHANRQRRKREREVRFVRGRLGLGAVSNRRRIQHVLGRVHRVDHHRGRHGEGPIEHGHDHVGHSEARVRLHVQSSDRQPKEETSDPSVFVCRLELHVDD